MKQFTIILIAMLSAFTFSVQAAPTTLSRAAAFLVAMSSKSLNPVLEEAQDNTESPPTIVLSADVEEPSEGLPEQTRANADDTPEASIGAPDTENSVINDDQDTVVDNDEDTSYPFWDTFTFTFNDETFTASFEKSPGAEVMACNGFSLFYNAGDPFTMLVVTDREPGDDNIVGLLANWRDLLSRRYVKSIVNQVSRGSAYLSNGFITADSLFFITPENKFVRVKVVLSDKNSYVMSTNFEPGRCETSNVFFESFQIN